MKTCILCGLTKDINEFGKDKYLKSGYSNRCKTCLAKLSVSKRKKQKHIVFSHYGYECACCGEKELAFLSIDHINNDGNKSRMKDGTRRAGAVFYQWIITNNFPDDLRTLCHNCNLGRHINGGICPHEATRNNPN